MQVRHPLAILALFLLSLAACGEPGESRTETAVEAGEDARVAVLSPAIADVMRDIGMGDAIVARHGFDQFSDPGLPIVGDQTGLDYESLIRVEPTHVILEQSATGVPPELGRLASEREWQLVEIPMLTLDDVIDVATRLRELLPKQADHRRYVEAIISTDFAIGDSEHRFGSAECLRRTLLVLSTNPIGVIGPGSHHWEALARADGTVVPMSGESYQTLSLEDVIALSPDTIILFRPDMNAAENAPLVEVDLAELGPLASLDDARAFACVQPKALLPSLAVIDFVRAVRGVCDEGEGE